MNNLIIGTCSRCGGAVSVPYMWGSVIPPTPTCRQCGAIAAQHGPVIDMQPGTALRAELAQREGE